MKRFGSRDTNSWGPCLALWAVIAFGFVLFGWGGAVLALGASVIGGLGSVYNAWVRGFFDLDRMARARRKT